MNTLTLFIGQVITAEGAEVFAKDAEEIFAFLCEYLGVPLRLNNYRRNHKQVPAATMTASVQPQCSMCLCGESFLRFIHHRDTEDHRVYTEENRKPPPYFTSSLQLAQS